MANVKKIKYNTRKKQLSFNIFISRLEISEKEWKKLLKDGSLVDNPSLQGIRFDVINNVGGIK